jgi:hypothetical protein
VTVFAEDPCGNRASITFDDLSISPRLDLPRVATEDHYHSATEAEDDIEAKTLAALGSYDACAGDVIVSSRALSDCELEVTAELDGCANQGNPAARQVYVVVLDAAPPVITILTPPDCTNATDLEAWARDPRNVSATDVCGPPATT